jgi:transposase-like protein
MLCEISVSAVARAAGVDRSFLYRHHDLRAQIHARAAAPGTSPASTAPSRQSLLADLANLQAQNQRLRRQNLSLTARLSGPRAVACPSASAGSFTNQFSYLKTSLPRMP